MGPTVQYWILLIMTGTVPASFETAVVKPLFKNPHLDPGCLNNYQPVSILPFFSKMLWLIQQLSAHSLNSNLLEAFHSAFMPCQSTETEFTKVVNLLLTMDSKTTSVLLLLDLSAAFGTINHCILPDRLENEFAVSGMGLVWLKYYILKEHIVFPVVIVHQHFVGVKYGVPQGCVLDHLLFSHSISPLGQII